MSLFKRDADGRALVPMHLSVRKTVRPGETTQIVVGAPNDEWSSRRLRDMREAQVASLVLDTPSAGQVIEEMTGLPMSRTWCLLQAPRSRLLPSSPTGVPGDFDAICGEIRDGYISLEQLVSIEFKLAKARRSGDDLKYASGWGKHQARGASLLGFDQVLLVHLLVRDPISRSNDQAPWADAADAATFRIDMERVAGRLATGDGEYDVVPYGTALIGLGHADGVDPADSMALTPVPLTMPPIRPFNDQRASREARREIEWSLRMLLPERMPAARFFGFCTTCGAIDSSEDAASVVHCHRHR